MSPWTLPQLSVCKHRAAKENADPLKRMPLRFVYGHYGKTWRNGKLPSGEDERKLALARGELTSWNEGPLAYVWPSRDFDAKDPRRSGDGEAARAFEQPHR